MLSQLSTRHQNSQWVNWINEWGLSVDDDKNFRFQVLKIRKVFLKTIADKIGHELTINY